GQVRRNDCEQRREAVLVVRERVAERGAGGTRLRPDDQVDVRDFVAIADERFAEKEICCHVEHPPYGKVSRRCDTCLSSRRSGAWSQSAAGAQSHSVTPD